MVALRLRRAALLTAVSALFPLFLSPTRAVATKRLKAACPGGYFLAQGGGLVPGDSAPNAGVIVVLKSQMSVGSACPATIGKVRPSPRGTVIAGRWRSCAGVGGEVQLKGIIEPTGCAIMRGVMRGKTLKRHFVAGRVPAPTCGNGTVDVGEPCDTEAVPAGCPVGFGCTQRRGLCACVPSCDTMSPGEAAIRTAVATAISDRLPDPWADPKSFRLFLSAVEQRLQCSMRTGGTSAVASCTGSFDPNVNYCGPGTSCTTLDLALLSVGSCVNRACFQHAACYTSQCVSQRCYFTSPEGDACDSALLGACAGCSRSTTDDVLCDLVEALRTRPAPPACSQSPCPLGQVCDSLTGTCGTPGMTATMMRITQLPDSP